MTKQNEDIDDVVPDVEGFVDEDFSTGFHQPRSAFSSDRAYERQPEIRKMLEDE